MTMINNKIREDIISIADDQGENIEKSLRIC